MDNKRLRLIYLISTILLTLMMGVLSAGTYIVKHEIASEMFVTLGYPTYIIYPLAVLKILGLIAIWTGKSKTLKEWAYAGFFFDLFLAVISHAMVDGEYMGAVIALIILFTSYFSHKKLSTSTSLTEEE